MNSPTILELQNEVLERVKSTTTFANKAWTAFNLDDLTTNLEGGGTYPVAGIVYEGGEIPQQQIDIHNKSKGTKAVNTYRVRFSVIIGIDYRGAGGPDTKVDAMTLLQEVRQVMHGYKGINNRPWTFVAEVPLDGDEEGVIFYGQLWMTDIFLTGNHTEL